MSIFHPLRSAYVKDSHAEDWESSLREVLHYFHMANPSLDVGGVMNIHIRRVHQDDDDVEGAPA